MNLNKIREEFPILKQEVYKKPLVYLDNAATTQKPIQVIDAITHYYTSMNSNIHRGAHYLSNISTEAFERTRSKVQKFINAAEHYEVIYTRGTTESINLVAHSFGKAFLKKGDQVIVSAMEHHSNIVPWQMACEEYGAELKVIPMNEKGELLMDAFKELLNEKTRIVSVGHVSNSLGSINPIKEIIEIAHQQGVPVMIDGAQGIAHCGVDVQELDCDFYAFSAHKMYGPTGIGILYGKEKWLNKMPPYQGGGEMIKEVSFEKTTYNELPFKFEAGTPNIADVIGFEAALDYVMDLGIENMAAYEDVLLKYATSELQNIEGIRIIGQAENKTAVISFVFEDIHHFDAGTILDKLGIAVRTGHHCAQPVMNFFNVGGTIRASFAVYNTSDEIDVFIEGLLKVKELFG
ncbi:MAG: cysteine desulfurase [Bacteroidales bacterium]|nr:cysteine desulfurase [Bacteroidales bacterium]